MRSILLSLGLLFTFGVSTRIVNAQVFNLVVNSRSICTAFAVEGAQKQQVLMTAGHCVEKLQPEDVIYAYDAPTNTRYPVKVLAWKHKWFDSEDYAILGYTSTRGVPPISLKTTLDIPKVGDGVSVIEGPLGLCPITVRGFYAGLARVADEPDNEINGMHWIQLPGAPGASGSPVMDSTGRVWGILVGGHPSLGGMTLIALVPTGIYGL